MKAPYASAASRAATHMWQPPDLSLRRVARSPQARPLRPLGPPRRPPTPQLPWRRSGRGQRSWSGTSTRSLPHHPRRRARGRVASDRGALGTSTGARLRSRSIHPKGCSYVSGSAALHRPRADTARPCGAEGRSARRSRCCCCTWRHNVTHHNYGRNLSCLSADLRAVNPGDVRPPPQVCAPRALEDPQTPSREWLGQEIPSMRSWTACGYTCTPRLRRRQVRALRHSNWCRTSTTTSCSSTAKRREEVWSRPRRGSRSGLGRSYGRIVADIRVNQPSFRAWLGGTRFWTKWELQQIRMAQTRMTRRVARWFPLGAETWPEFARVAQQHRPGPCGAPRASLAGMRR